MRAWDETEDALRRQAEKRAEAHEETLRDLDEHGIVLDPGAERTGARRRSRFEAGARERTLCAPLAERLADVRTPPPASPRS